MLGTEQMLTGSKCLLENVLAISWFIIKYKEKLMDDSIKEAIIAEGKKQLELIANQGIKSTFAMIYAYVAATDNKVDDAIIPFLQLAEKALLEQAAKIDGE